VVATSLPQSAQLVVETGMVIPQVASQIMVTLKKYVD
jgi:hypothetical protein